MAAVYSTVTCELPKSPQRGSRALRLTVKRLLIPSSSEHHMQHLLQQCVRLLLPPQGYSRKLRLLKEANAERGFSSFFLN